MSKLLVNAPTGKQELIEVGVGGGYFDASRIVWDERVDGPLPDVQLGGMVRSGGSLVLDPVLLATSQAAAVWVDAIATRIRDERDRRKLDGGYKVMVSGVAKWFHSDTFSRTQQIGLVLLGAGIPPGTLWKTMDGSFVTMIQTLAQQIFGAAAQQDIATFAAAETHIAAMKASPNPAAYDYSSGWPAIFLD